MAEKRTEAGRLAKMAYNDQYNKNTYDNLHLRVKKGVKDEYKRAADRLGISLAALVTSAVDEYIENHIK